MDHLLRPFKISEIYRPLMTETPRSSLHSSPLIHSAEQSSEMWSQQIYLCFLFCELNEIVSLLFLIKCDLKVVSERLEFGEEEVLRGTCLTATKEERRENSDTWMTSNYFPCPSNCVLMQGCDQTWYEQLQAFKWKWFSKSCGARVWAFVLRCSMGHS